MSNGFTGRHMAAVMIGFFGVVIGVNAVMATEAARTFGGTVVDNSYVANQHFNRWLDEAGAQRRLGWKADMTGRAGHLVVATVPGARVTGRATHPLGRLPEQALGFDEARPGEYVSRQAVPAGRWRVHLSVMRDGRRADFLDDATL